uniref:Uncharacterized protein n=1 Tax=Octopus bimaculoides TaxID=37653 RepID=A0A0L8HLV0_OCTBM
MWSTMVVKLVSSSRPVQIKITSKAECSSNWNKQDNDRCKIKHLWAVEGSSEFFYQT